MRKLERGRWVCRGRPPSSREMLPMKLGTAGGALGFALVPGACGTPETGGADACIPENDAAFCMRLGKNCGSATASDNCGTRRMVASCGTCTSPQSCGIDNVCAAGRVAQGRRRWAGRAMSRARPDRCLRTAELAARQAPPAGVPQVLRPTRAARRAIGAHLFGASCTARPLRNSYPQCPGCQGRMTPIAVITEREVIEKIPTHLRLPLVPEVLSDGHTVAYDITGEPMLDGDLGPSSTLQRDLATMRVFRVSGPMIFAAPQGELFEAWPQDAGARSCCPGPPSARDGEPGARPPLPSSSGPSRRRRCSASRWRRRRGQR